MRFLRRHKLQPSKVEELKPHVWIWLQEELIGGTVRFLLRSDDLDANMSAGLFEEEFLKIDTVFRVRLYATYIAVQWGARDNPDREGLTPITITALGLGLLAQHFDWQGELRVREVQSLEELYELKQREGLQDRWRFGVR